MLSKMQTYNLFQEYNDNAFNNVVDEHSLDEALNYILRPFLGLAITRNTEFEMARCVSDQLSEYCSSIGVRFLPTDVLIDNLNNKKDIFESNGWGFDEDYFGKSSYSHETLNMRIDNSLIIALQQSSVWTNERNRQNKELEAVNINSVKALGHKVTHWNRAVSSMAESGASQATEYITAECESCSVKIEIRCHRKSVNSLLVIGHRTFRSLYYHGCSEYVLDTENDKHFICEKLSCMI